jgi:hypothetical protein
VGICVLDAPICVSPKEAAYVSIVSTGLSRIERKRVVRAKEAARLRGESVDSVRRHLRGKEVQLGDRNVGFRLEDVLQLPPEEGEENVA